MDLTLLARGSPEDVAAAAAGAIPLPKFRWKTRILLPVLIFGAAGGLLLYAAGDVIRPVPSVQVVPVIVKSGVQGGASGATVQAPGWVEADPFPTAVSALAEGVVQEVLVLEGERVSAGQVVARLVDADAQLAVQRAEAEVRERESALLAAKAGLNAAQRTWDNPVELRRALAFKEAEAAEKRAELRRWPAQVAAEEAKMKSLQAEYERLTPIHAKGQASEIEYIRAHQDYLAQKATYEAAVADQPILEAELAAIEADVAAARQNLELRIEDTKELEEARSMVHGAEAALLKAQAMLAEARLMLERTQVRSPVDGVVMVRYAQVGSKLMLKSDMATSAQVVQLYNPEKLQVRVDVPLAEAANVSIGQDAEITVNVLPDRTFRGRVTRVVHEADIQKNTLQVKVAIESPVPELKPEMLARVRFLPQVKDDGRQEQERVFAPETIVRPDAAGHAQAWIVDQASGTAELRHVMVGAARIGGWREVVSGLHPGDRLIAGETGRLQAGQKVRIAGEAPTLSSEHAGTEGH